MEVETTGSRNEGNFIVRVLVVEAAVNPPPEVVVAKEVKPVVSTVAALNAESFKLILVAPVEDEIKPSRKEGKNVVRVSVVED